MTNMPETSRRRVAVVRRRARRLTRPVTALVVLAVLSGCGASTTTPDGDMEAPLDDATLVFDGEDPYMQVYRIDDLDDGHGGTRTCFVFDGSRQGGLDCFAVDSPERTVSP